MKRKIKYIIGIIWWQFKKKKVKRRLFERVRVSSSKLPVDNSPVSVNAKTGVKTIK